MAKRQFDWAAIDADPKFQELHRRKSAFLALLMLVSISYYFLLPVGAAYFPELFAWQLFGPVNFGILFALSEFAVALGVAFLYARRANTVFDRMAADIARDAIDKYRVR